MSYPTNIFHTSPEIEGHKKYTNNLTGTRLKVQFWQESEYVQWVYLCPQNGGAAFNLTLAQFEQAVESSTYEEGWH